MNNLNIFLCRLAIVAPALLLLASGCDLELLNSTKKENETLKTRFQMEKGNFDHTLQKQSERLDAANKRIEELEQLNESLTEFAKSKTLIDPTFAQLNAFLAGDKTKEKTYVLHSFDCTGFAIELRDRAREFGLRAAFVEIGLGADNAGHALNAFTTKDMGLIYVDVGGRDAIGYVEVGKPYGVINLASVKSEYIDCSGKPDEFFQPRRLTQYTGNIFEYAYYENYLRRREFYKNSADAYNLDVDMRERDLAVHNAEVLKFNARASTYTLPQMNAWRGRIDQWADKLKTWKGNLDALSAELGSGVKVGDAANLISHVELYWP